MSVLVNKDTKVIVQGITQMNCRKDTTQSSRRKHDISSMFISFILNATL